MGKTLSADDDKFSETETIGDIRLTSTFRTLAVYTHKQDKKYAEQEESHARAL